MSNIFRNTNNGRNRGDDSDYRMFNVLNLINMYNDNNININRLIEQNNHISQTLLALMSANNSHGRQNRFNTGISYIIDNIGIRTPNNNNNNNNNDNIDVDVENILADFLNPVVISPTSQQIEVATRNIRYGNILRPLNESCCFTLETFREDDIVTMIRHCQHIFSRESLQNWFRSNYRCPICRYDIRRYSIDSITNASSIPLSTTPRLATRIPSQLITRGFSRNFDNNDTESELPANLINQITDIILARNENGNDTRDISANIV